MVRINLIIMVVLFVATAAFGQTTIETARKTLLFEKDTLFMERNEVRWPVMVEKGKRVNYKNGIYILQSDLGVLKNYGYHKIPAPDMNVADQAKKVLAKGEAVDIGSYGYVLFTANIKYYYLGKYKVPVPTGYYKDNAERQRTQGYSRMFVPVYVVTGLSGEE